MATLNVETKIVAFGDVSLTNNPRLKYVDWLRTAQGIQISKPVSKDSEIGPDDVWDVAGLDTQGATVIPSSVNNAVSITSVEATSTRTKLFGIGDFGNFVTNIDSLSSIQVLANGNVIFTTSSNLDQVSVGDSFWITGNSTGDVTKGISYLNEGFWKVLKVSSTTLTCQKVNGSNCAISETYDPALSAPSTMNQISVFRDCPAKPGDYIALYPAGSPDNQSLFQITYADAYRIDVGYVEFTLPDSFDTVVTKDRFKFAYIETSGKATLTIQVGTVDYSIRIVPMSLPNGEKLGWAQITSDFNHISVQNTDNQNIRVSAIVGG